MAMVRISGRQRRSEWKIKRDIDDFSVLGGKMRGVEQPKMKRSGNDLYFTPETTINPSVYLKTGEKIMVDMNTKEVRIR